MSHPTLEVTPGPGPRQVKTQEGATLTAPADWDLLPPGDAALSRRIKKEGPHWVVKEKKGRKVFSRGIWAPHKNIQKLRTALEEERRDPAYERKLEAGRKRRAARQEDYVLEFEAAVRAFLRFSSSWKSIEEKMARAITLHAVPVGSGTVARTTRIPVERRAEAAVIAWMRHQTTAYDSMNIPRVKGMRRQVRRMLAEESRMLLAHYRQGGLGPRPQCPLLAALSHEVDVANSSKVFGNPRTSSRGPQVLDHAAPLP